MDYSTRWTTQRGTRPIRIANCSGAKMDPGYQMHRQATQGSVDIITGDYLAEFNLALNASAFAAGQHPGWEETAWDGLQQTIEVAARKNIRIVINGGAVNPRGLAEKTRSLARSKGLRLNVGHVEGDDLLGEMREMLDRTGELPGHLDPEDDSSNADSKPGAGAGGSGIRLAKDARAYLDKTNHPLVSANAYLGARAIVQGLQAGADILICGRVADASPVIGAAWYWHSWSATDYDRLAGALIAGHLIECSGYVTGSNFSGFVEYPVERLLDIGYPVAEVEADGSCVVTKHEGTNGVVGVENVACQFLYELQGEVYLHSDVTAHLSGVTITQAEGKDRVKVTGIKGTPPPPTTKLAIFYQGGYELQLLINATGFSTPRKFALLEAQCRLSLVQQNIPLSAFTTLEFQRVGSVQHDARKMLDSTTYLRIFAQAERKEVLGGLLKGYSECGMQHFSGMHGSLDSRAGVPRGFLAYYPAVWEQGRLRERCVVVFDRKDEGVEGGGGDAGKKEGVEEVTLEAGHPPSYAPLPPRKSYDAPPLSSLTPNTHPFPLSASSLTYLQNPSTPTLPLPLGTLLHARSGDKGANLNIGLFPRSSLSDLPLARAWLRSFLSISTFISLLGDEWKPEEYHVERTEFEGIGAVHFVVYGWLGRGVCGCSRLDSLGKGVGDWIRDRVVSVPVEVARGGRDEEGVEVDVDALVQGGGGEAGDRGGEKSGASRL